VLEDRRMMSVTSPVETVYRDLVSVEVVDRNLFYNNSAHDGNNPAINAADDLAIADDKSALLPGGTATFANYSSYSRGINGLMVDIAGLPTDRLTAADFDFRVGNGNTPGSWTTAAAPTSISVRLGAGVWGSARVEIVWPDGAIQKQWLQVTVKATPNTGLTTADVFYFGNAVGESGNTGADAIVDAIDAEGAQNNPLNPAPITAVYDFNRDGLVNASDATVATNNTTTAGTALKLIATPALVASPAPERLQTSIFNWGNGGYPVFSGPAIVTTAAGTVLAFAEGRATTKDSASYAIVMRRSTDGGVTWSPLQQVVGVPPSTGIVVSQPAPIVDKITGEVFLLFNRGTISDDGLTVKFHLTDVYFTKSSDDGLTWSAPTDITDSVTVTEGHNPGPSGLYPDTPWGWAIVGPGHGIQIENGPHAGRLIVGGDHRETQDNSGKSWSHVIYSDDHGLTWNLGGGLVGLSDPDLNHVNDRSNENSIVELDGGVLYMSIRVQRSEEHFRGKSFSFDGGITWTDMQAENDIGVFRVQGSVLRLNDNVLLFSSPASTDWEDETRHEMSIWASYDNGQNWVKKKVVFFGYAGYSDMTVVGPDTVLLTFMRGWTGGLGQADSGVNSPEFYGEIGMARINLRWLESTDPYEFDWYFNEEAPGAISDYRGSGVQDYGPWDQRAWARASNANVAARYVAGPAGDSALELTSQSGANGVVLSQAFNTALQAGPDDNFTVQIMLKTTDTQGTIIGTRTNIRNWSLLLVDGKVQFSLYDTENLATISSPAAINDGQWHHLAAVRDAAGRLLHLYVDHVEVTPAVVDTATKPYGQTEHVLVDPVYLGAFNTLTAASKLDVTVDTLRFTRAALAPDKFFGADLVSTTPPPPPPPYLPNNPTSIPGLQLWLPAYDPTRYFSDFGSFTNPLPLSPFAGMATRSMIEASGNAFQVQTDNSYRHVLYGEDSVMGPYWIQKAEPGAQFGSEWWVHNKTNSVTNSFDFVQNTGVFTMSTFVNMGAATGGYMTIFDTSEGSTAKPGFSLFLQQNGLLFLSVTGGTEASVRFFDSAPAGAAITPSTWYHIAVVGTGPGNPLQFYVTPVSDSTVTAFNSTSTLAGDNGTYPTDLNHELFIGSRSNKQSPGASPFNGGMVNQAIYDTALTSAQIEQLFRFGKGLTNLGPAWQNPVDPNDVSNNGKVQASDVAILVNRLLQNLGGTLPEPGPGNSPPPYLDPSGNNILNAGDVAKVINWLLTHPPEANPVVAQADAGLDDADPLAANGAESMAATEKVVTEIAASPQVTLVPPLAAEMTPAQADSAGFAESSASETPVAAASSTGASVLLVQPRYSSTSAGRRASPGANCGDEADIPTDAGTDAYFAALARTDEEGDEPDLVITAPWARRANRAWRAKA
jgi:hypothetical protein